MNSQQPTSNDVIILLATYNEIDNLPQLVEELLSTLPKANVLIVDDNSPDGTGTWALEKSRREPRVKTIVRENERGLGSAVIRGLTYAIDNNYRLAVNMDADFSHSVQDVPRLIERVDQPGSETDVAIGSRYIRGGSVPDWSLRRRVMSRCINGLARAALGLKTKDNSGSFRCYRVSVLRDLDFAKFISTGYSFFEEMLFRLKLANARFAEIPIVFLDRKEGSSKINRIEAVKAVWTILKLGTTRSLFHAPNSRSPINAKDGI